MVLLVAACTAVSFLAPEGDGREPLGLFGNTVPLLTVGLKGKVCTSGLALVGPFLLSTACCSSVMFSRRTTSARADLSSWMSSSCIWTRCSREAMRSVTSMLLAAEALSSAEGPSPSDMVQEMGRQPATGLQDAGSPQWLSPTWWGLGLPALLRVHSPGSVPPQPARPPPPPHAGLGR